MSELNDPELLAKYASHHSEQAFSELVERYIALVYSAALRQVRNPHTAEDVTQAVFTILAEKAPTLIRHPALAGWLCRTTHFVARNALKSEFRRQHREHQAHMQSLLNDSDDSAWTQVAPMLDEAVAQLNELDRNAVVLRFYRKQSLDQVGNALGISTDAAQKRISRAVEKLRAHFNKRGATLSSVALIGVITANSAKAAPLGLSLSITPTAIQGATASTTTATLAKTTIKLMAWTKLKTTAAVCIGVLALTGAATITVQKLKPANFDPAGFHATTYPTGDPAAMQYMTNSYGHPLNYTFPISPVTGCSINGLLNQCMEVSGWRYLIDKEIAGGSVKFGPDKVMNGAEWVAAFESALQTNTPEWWDPTRKKFRNENLVLIRYPKQKTVLVVTKDKASKYGS
ncbi:MAG: hypothetical protein JWO95_2511 [Verrucomicrobiales bacterium]|nr:hypothetical protein [Verrucomicrobiales bacterium]